MPGLRHDVFLSYRRVGGSLLAQLLYAALQERGYGVFKDDRKLPAGLFDLSLRREIENTPNFVVLLTPGCHVSPGQSDWYRTEIGIALENNKTILPVRTEDFDFAVLKGLPASDVLRTLAGYDTVTYSVAYSTASIQEIERKLQSSPTPAVYLEPTAISDPTVTSLGLTSATARVTFSLREEHSLEFSWKYITGVFQDKFLFRLLRDREEVFHKEIWNWDNKTIEDSFSTERATCKVHLSNKFPGIYRLKVTVGSTVVLDTSKIQLKHVF